MNRIQLENLRTAGRDSMTLIVRDLGRMGYGEAFALQKGLQAEVIAARAKPTDEQTPLSAALAGRSEGMSDDQRLHAPATSPPAEPGANGGEARVGHLLLVEHDPPVITVSARKSARQNLIASAAQLAKAGIDVAETDRGGDITYHGPGQLVVYPILDLNVLGLRLHGYMRLLEAIVIEALAHFGIEGHRDETATGVWVKSKAHGSEFMGLGSGSAKICAMGVRISRWVSMHGLALNVTTNLDHFNLIVPCGLAGRAVTSMQRELGAKCPTMDEVKRVLVDQFRARTQAHG